MKKLTLLLTLLFSFSALSLDYGIDRIQESEFAGLLTGKNLAVLTHAPAVNKKGEHLIDLLFKNYSLKKIFAPEHGLRTNADEWVGDGKDEATGLPIISLYKRTSKGPTAEDLKGIDAIVIDLQDVGVRYYTYFSTIAEVMKASAKHQVEILILDRPNLLGGEILEGKVLDPELTGQFTAYHTVPTRHGMTLGELARMINQEKEMKVKLTVIPAQGWARENLLQQTERPWIAPSPALIELKQVGLYALWGTLESLNLSVGRGKTNELAFKVIGAPWMTVEESKTLAARLNGLRFKGVRFGPFSWTVTRAKYTGQLAHGVRLEWDNSEVRTDEFTYKVSALLVRLFPARVGVANLPTSSLGSLRMVQAIKDQTPWVTYSKLIDQELEAFRNRRRPYLLY